jgi:hypothetical protein
MISDTFESYEIKAAPILTVRKKWLVSVTIQKNTTEGLKEERFTAHDGIEYILEIEAAKESLNLAKNLIRLNRVGF